MKLLRIATHNFAGLPDGTYEFASGQRPAQLTCVTGAAASGKTSLLRAICALQEHLAPSSAPFAPGAWLRLGETRGELRGWFLLAADEAATSQGDQATQNELTIEVVVVLSKELEASPSTEGLRTLFGHGAPVRPLEYFPAGRRFSGRMRPATTPTSLLRLPEDGDRFDAHLEWLLERHTADGRSTIDSLQASGLLTVSDRPDSLSGLRAGLANLLPDLRLVRIEPRTLRPPQLLFARRDDTSIELQQLSRSEQDAVLLACAIWRHVENQGSIVLIDDFDPAGPVPAVTRLRALAELAGTMQLIITKDTAPREFSGHTVRLGTSGMEEDTP